MLEQRRTPQIALVLVTAAVLVGAAAAGAALPQRVAMPDSEFCTTPIADTGAEASFLAENDAAMKTMMAGMTVKPTGDVDADFVAMMVAHHQGAIDMALAVLRHGRNPQIRRLAQEIIVTQQQEIVVMRRAVGQPLPPSRPAPTEPLSVEGNDSNQSIARTLGP